jgi:hypothetical protein
MVGNSLTETNDLPGMVRRLASRAGEPAPVVDFVGFPDYSLADHLREGSALAKLRSRRYSHLVLQQGPTSLPSSGADLRESLGAWVQRAEVVGVRIGLYGVWPPEGGSLEGSVANYAAAATAHAAALYPAGAAFLLARTKAPSVRLLSSDRFHPSVAGSWLAALVITGTILQTSPSSLPAVPGLAVEAQDQVQLRLIADEIVRTAARR